MTTETPGAANREDLTNHCGYVCLKGRDHDGPHFYGYRMGPYSYDGLLASLDAVSAERDGWKKMARNLDEALSAEKARGALAGASPSATTETPTDAVRDALTAWLRNNDYHGLVPDLLATALTDYVMAALETHLDADVGGLYEAEFRRLADHLESLAHETDREVFVRNGLEASAGLIRMWMLEGIPEVKQENRRLKDELTAVSAERDRYRVALEDVDNRLSAVRRSAQAGRTVAQHALGWATDDEAGTDARAALAGTSPSPAPRDLAALADRWDAEGDAAAQKAASTPERQASWAFAEVICRRHARELRTALEGADPQPTCTNCGVPLAPDVHHSMLGLGSCDLIQPTEPEWRSTQVVDREPVHYDPETTAHLLRARRRASDPQPTEPEPTVCADCAGTKRDAEHRRARMIRDVDHLSCSLHGDVGWDYIHGHCPTCRPASDPDTQEARDG